MIPKVLQTAANEVGTVSNPNTMNNKYNKWYYGGNVNSPKLHWCVVFVAWVLEQCGIRSLLCGGTKTAFVPYVVNYAKKHGQWVEKNLQPGDLIIFDWNGDGSGDHIGIVETVNSDGSYVTIEGNTTDGKNKSCVARKTRKGKSILGAYRPKYVQTTRVPDSVPAWAKEAWDWCKSKGLMDGTRPNDEMTRAEVAVVIKRLFDLKG